MTSPSAIQARRRIQVSLGRPDIPRPFKTPLVPFVPVLGILSCLYLMLNLPKDTWIRLFAWMGIGLVIYFTYGIRKSKLRRRI